MSILTEHAVVSLLVSAGNHAFINLCPTLYYHVISYWKYSVTISCDPRANVGGDGYAISEVG